MCRLGLVTPRQVQSAAIKLAGRPGRPAAMQAAHLLDPRAESVFESISRVRVVTAGLPAPVPQLDIVDRDGIWIARVDFAWPGFRLVLECDGYEYHRGRDAFQRDRRRWSALTRADWKVVIVTWRDLMDDPNYLLDLVADLTNHVSTYNSPIRRAV
jgi:hypothetical protein